MALSYNILLIIVIGLLLRAPLYHTPFWRTNDTMEYINIARNINAGRGLTQSIKFHLYDPAPVVTSALRSRPPLTSLIYSGLLRIYDDPYFLQVFNLSLGILNALIIYALTRSLLAGLFSVTNPNILITGRMALSDQLFATFALLAALIYFRCRESFIKYALLGISIALLSLTRLEGLWLLPILALAFRKKIAMILVMTGAFFVVMSPYFWLNTTTNGSPLFNKNNLHYRLFDVREGTEGGFEKNLPTPTEFIRANWSFVLPQVIPTTGWHLLSLAGLAYFGPLTLFLILQLRNGGQKYWPWSIFCAGVILLYGSLWSATFERSRHFIFVYLLLLFPVADYLKTHRGKLVFFILMASFAGYLFLDARRIIWARTVDPTVSVWDQTNKTPIYSWINQNTPPDVIIASTNPFMVNLQTTRPAIALPTNLTSENLPRYLAKFDISYVLLINEDRLDALFNQFTLAANLASGRIYQIKFPG